MNFTVTIDENEFRSSISDYWWTFQAKRESLFWMALIISGVEMLLLKHDALACFILGLLLGMLIFRYSHCRRLMTSWKAVLKREGGGIYECELLEDEIVVKSKTTLSRLPWDDVVYRQSRERYFLNFGSGQLPIPKSQINYAISTMIESKAKRFKRK